MIVINGADGDSDSRQTAVQVMDLRLTRNRKYPDDSR